MFRDDTKLYLEQINEQLAERIYFLEELLRNEREEKKRLMDKILGVERRNIEYKSFGPVGGFKTLKSRLREAEEKSRTEWNKQNASEEQ